MDWDEKIIYYPDSRGGLIQGINPAIKKITFFAASFLYRGANTGAPWPLSRVGLNTGARK